MNAPYFPFYPRDWLADPKVMFLSYDERGVYFQLLCLAWTYGEDTCSLPNDDRALAKLLGLTPEEWARYRQVLVDGDKPVFHSFRGRLVNSRLKLEYEKLREKSKNLSVNAKKRWAKAETDVDTTEQSAAAIAEQKHMQLDVQLHEFGTCISEPELEPDSDTKKKTDTESYPSDFLAFWSEYPRKVEKRKAFKAWKTRLKEGTSAEQMLTAARNYATACKKEHTEERYMKHPATFLGPTKPFEDYLEARGSPEKRPSKYDSLMIG